jgi:alpha-L-fucosidase
MAALLPHSISSAETSGDPIAPRPPHAEPVSAQTPAHSASSDPSVSPSANPADNRMDWWRNARFGMFIHWGLYSPAAGKWDGKEAAGAGEWLLTNAQVDPIAYREALLPQFNPVKFDAAEWASIARDAGMQYVVITSKHHDGFCLWPSDLTDYDVESTPFKRDIMKELADAVRADGMRMGWYHSIMDWTHPDYLPRRGWDKRPSDGASFDRYVAYMHGQLKELLTRYGQVDVLWFDGEWESTWTHDWGKRTDDFVRSLQPQIIVNNRVDVGRAGMAGFSASETARGDFGTPEQTIPTTGMPGRDWETCMTMNDTWGFKDSDTNWKSSRTLIRMLCDIASKGGNFLLNVGPRGDGTIPPESVERLKAIGAWMRVNGESIYGTHASPFARPLPWGRVTQRAGGGANAKDAASARGAADGGTTTLYLHVFEWPTDGVLRVTGLANEVVSASVLGAEQGDARNGATTLLTTRDAGGVAVATPRVAPNADCTVIALVVKGAPEVAPWFIGPDARGAVVCTARDATTTGSIAFEERFQNLGFWTDPQSTAEWTVKVPTPGRYAIAVEYAAEPGAGGVVEVTAGDATLTHALPARTSWGDFASVILGEADIPGGRLVHVRARAARFAGSAFVNVRAVTLTPVPGSR